VNTHAAIRLIAAVASAALGVLAAGAVVGPNVEANMAYYALAVIKTKVAVTHLGW